MRPINVLMEKLKKCILILFKNGCTLFKISPIRLISIRANALAERTREVRRWSTIGRAESVVFSSFNWFVFGFLLPSTLRMTASLFSVGIID